MSCCFHEAFIIQTDRLYKRYAPWLLQADKRISLVYWASDASEKQNMAFYERIEALTKSLTYNSNFNRNFLSLLAYLFLHILRHNFSLQLWI